MTDRHEANGNSELIGYKLDIRFQRGTARLCSNAYFIFNVGPTYIN